ncbi:MAG: type I secretion system permease/ATPase [Burkholderiales bacterium PBB3]|nr:MAG: type I secretion system permease/ATPase [Burkholderiales bacterium PBB3]
MSVKKPPTELERALAGLRPYFVRAGWFSLFCSLLVLMPTWYMLEVYGRVVNSGNHMTLAMVTLLVVIAYAVMELLEWTRSQVLHEGSLVMDRALSTRVFQAIFEANLRKLPGGSLQPMNDLKTIRDFIHSPVLMGLMESPVSIVFLVLMFVIHPLLGWVTMAFAVIQVFVGWLNERSTQPPLTQANRSAIEAQQYADGTLRNAQVIESMGMVRDIHRRWMRKQREFLGLQALASDRAGGFQAISKFIQHVVGSAMLGLSTWLLLHEQLGGGAGMLIGAGILAGRVLAPLVQVVTQWRGVINVRDAWGRLNQLLADVPARPSQMSLPAPKGFVQVENIIAGAPNNPQAILRGVNFSLTPGEVLAVVGPSAAGKTTLARLLVGSWPTASGKVRLDGADIFTWNKSELGPHVGYLPQGVELFDGTLAENIARFGKVEMAKVRAAAVSVGLHEFISQLPKGYDSPIGNEGAMLSGGQRQRVALARAIYGDPVFVVLDEPNSSLDDAGDTALSSAIAELKARGTTFVVMTHRSTVLAVSDKMLLLRDGQMQAFGPRDDVIAAINKANAQAASPVAPRQGATAAV